MTRIRRASAGGGFPALLYTLRKSHGAGGVLRMWRALRAKNACKTCALGMGGQQGGMVNEAGRFPEVCKKSVQAMAADMQGAIRPGFFDEFSLAHLASFSSRELEHAGRLTQPLIADPGDLSYRPISWEEALARVAAALKATTPDRSFFYFSGRSSNEAAFLLQLFARVYGTNNVNNCSFFCHQASGVALSQVTGTWTSTVGLEDIDLADLVFLIGANPASNHPRLMRSIMDLKRRGGKVIVVNPIREVGLVNFRVPSDPWSLLFGTKVADAYVQPHIGGDIAFMLGLAKDLIERAAVARTFIEAHTEGWDDFRAHAEGTTWEFITERSGVVREAIREAADLYARSENAVFCWTMGMTHHEHGVDNVKMIGALALLRGMIGRPGAGLLPLRGHSNVQGVGSMGATPYLRPTVARAVEHRFGVTLPTSHGMDTMESVRAAGEGNVDFAWCLGGNLYGSFPDAAFAERSLREIGTTVFLSTTLNTGHIHGRGKSTIILPVLARDEEEQATTQESMFNFVRLSDGGKRRHDGPRSEVSIITAVAQAVLGAAGSEPNIAAHRVDFAALEDHANVRAAIAAIIPGYEGAGMIDQTKNEFEIPGRVMHTPSFRTPSGRARFHAVPTPVLKGDASDPRSLRLMTIRSEGQFNTVVYEEEDLYRGQERRDVVLMNASDISRLGLKPDDRVIVRSDTGEMRSILVREADIRAGNCAMYYPEANALVPTSVDRESRTPAFKSVPVRILPESRLRVVR
jgi:molybdopterin-dependent oxidoreductase alpha subunit